MAPNGLLAVLGVALSACVAVSTAECPAPEYINPLGCTCNPESHVRCGGIKDEKHLRLIMTACEGHELEEFVLSNVSLDWLPENLFDPINTRIFVLSHSTLRSLTKPQDSGTHFFGGSGIRTFFLDYTDLQDGDLIHLRDLDELEDLAIRGYHQTLFLLNLARLMGSTNLKQLILENITNLIWSTGALDAFEKLRTISLVELGLRGLSRNDLPEHAEELENLWLRNNMLTRLPPGFLDGMDGLKTLDLSNNRIVTLEEETFSNFHGFIALNGNRLSCDSRLDWLRRRLLEGSLKPMYGIKVTCDDGSPLIPDSYYSTALFQMPPKKRDLSAFLK